MHQEVQKSKVDVSNQLNPKHHKQSISTDTSNQDSLEDANMQVLDMSNDKVSHGQYLLYNILICNS